MRVLHVIPSLSLADGGPSRAVINMERALAARGVEVTTVTTDGAGSPSPAVCGTPHAARLGFKRTTGFYKTSVELGRWLGRNVGEFDVVHAHALFSFAPVAAAMAARRARVPYILRPLGLLSPYGMKKRRPWLKTASFRMIERPLLEGASAVHFTSRTEQSEADALGLRCRAVVIPLGVDVCDRSAPRRSEGPLKLLFLSRLDPKKNLESLLRAVAVVAASRPDVVLRIAGDGPAAYVRTLKALADALGVKDHVEWLGYVDGEAKARALARARIFVLPSFAENFAIAAAEALAAGLPCIVSPGVAIAEDIEAAGAGFVVAPTPEELAKAILRLASDPAAGSKMSLAARLLAGERFSIEAMGRNLETLYARLCPSTGAPRAPDIAA